MTISEANKKLQESGLNLKVCRTYGGFYLRDVSMEQAGIDQQYPYSLVCRVQDAVRNAKAGKVPVVACWVKVGVKNEI